LVCCFIAFCWINTPTFEKTINPQQISWNEGYAYTFPLPINVGFPYFIVGDEGNESFRSDLELLENGIPLGPAHVQHNEIRAQGGGRFSLWHQTIYFSSTDGSDPRRNGPIYSVRVRPKVWPGFMLLGSGLALLAVFSLKSVRLAIVRTAFLLSAPLHLTPRQLLLMVLVATVTACGAVVDMWHSGRTPSLGVAGFLPVSDSRAYWMCASQFLISADSWPSTLVDWCSRRVIYPSFLAGIMALTDWHPWLIYIVEATLVALGSLSLAVVCLGEIGIAGALIILFLLIGFMRVHAVGIAMTEVFGVAAGTSATALLIYGSRSPSFWATIAGLALFSAAMFARVGALPMLPALAAWAIWCWHNDGHSRKRLAYVLLATVAGLGLQWLIVGVQGLNFGASGGNFATTLYRLSTGAASWQQAYSDHPELFSRAISEGEAFKALYRMALENIVEQPSVMLLTYAREAKMALASLASFGVDGVMGLILISFYVLGLARYFKNPGNNTSALLLCANAAELISAPLLYGDGQDRAFASSLGFRAVIAGAGFAYALEWLLKVIQIGQMAPRARATLASGNKPGAQLAACVGAVLTVLVLSPNTPLVRPSILTPVAESSCQAPYIGRLARLDRESLTFSLLSDERGASLVPLRISMDRLRLAIPQNWFSDDFIAIKAPVVILQGIDRSKAGFGQHFDAFWQGSLPDHNGVVELCVSSNDSVSLAGVPYHKVAEIKTLSK
jgi:hypothetical protein